MPDLEGFDLPVERLWLEWGRVYSWRDAEIIKVSITTQEAAGLLKWRLNALNLWLAQMATKRTQPLAVTTQG